ncbi:MAG: hypothetical protein ABI083_06755 [Lapillicoccus sp.]
MTNDTQTPLDHQSPHGENPNGSGSTSTVEAAKTEAANVTQGALESGSSVLETAKQETGEVVAQAGQSARELYDQVRGELTDQAGTQQQRAAAGLRDLSTELDRMGKNTPGSGMASSLVQQASDRARSTADWLEQREPGDLVADVRHYAARRPGAFLAAAAALGFLGARLTKGLTADQPATTPSAPAARPADLGSADLSPVGPSPAVVTTPTAPVGIPTVTTVSHGEPVSYPSGAAGTNAYGEQA